MKRLLAVLPLLLLTGCAEKLPELPELAPLFSSEQPDAEPDSAQNTEPVSETRKRDAIIPADAPQIMTEAATDTLSARMLYVLTLRDLLEQHLLPSGSELEIKGDIEKNRFAVLDIDGDGREELILEISQADVENCFTAVYDMDADGDLRREVRYAAEVGFWSDGIVIATYTDARETDGEFVPFAAAQYDAQQDVYTEFAYVSALDKEMLEKQGLEDEYPEDADTSHSGRVYCIYGDTPVDVKEYEAWYDSWHTGLTETDVPLVSLTDENISKLED